MPLLYLLYFTFLIIAHFGKNHLFSVSIAVDFLSTSHFPINSFLIKTMINILYDYFTDFKPFVAHFAKHLEPKHGERNNLRLS